MQRIIKAMEQKYIDSLRKKTGYIRTTAKKQQHDSRAIDKRLRVMISYSC